MNEISSTGAIVRFLDQDCLHVLKLKIRLSMEFT